LAELPSWEAKMHKTQGKVDEARIRRRMAAAVAA
jgi:hypothetical protein